jgi:hypothetical protein
MPVFEPRQIFLSLEYHRGDYKPGLKRLKIPPMNTSALLQVRLQTKTSDQLTNSDVPGRTSLILQLIDDNLQAA